LHLINAVALILFKRKIGKTTQQPFAKPSTLNVYKSMIIRAHLA